MRIILAPDSFKGTFSSAEVIAMLEKGCHEHFPEAEIIRLPMADGGEGTVDAFISALSYRPVCCMVEDPLGRPVSACLGIKDDTAVIEMAQASGLTLLRASERNPMLTSSYGTGTLILKALDLGARKLLIGIGGSAVNDCGMGMAQALGAVFRDAAGNVLAATGSALAAVDTIDVSGMDSRLAACEITAICDVTNPLTGSHGATRIYGPQKGADPGMVDSLEQGMRHFRSLLIALTGRDPDDIPGSGAAGGMGAAIALLMGGALQPGTEAVLDFVDFDSLSQSADFVITGEGRLDEQSAYGKVPYGIARRCQGKSLKVFVLAGSVSGNPAEHFAAGVDGIYPIVTEPCSPEEILNNPQEKMEQAIDGMLRFIRAGTEICAGKSPHSGQV